MTNPSQSAGGQASNDTAGQDTPPPPPPPDRSWIEFDIGIRNQDPGVIERKVIDRHD